MQKIPAAQFKSQCLAVMDQVAESGQPVVVTKRGKPVVQIIRAKSEDDGTRGQLSRVLPTDPQDRLIGATALC